MKERVHLLEEIQRHIVSPVQVTNNESQTDDAQYENSKRILEIFNTKLDQIAKQKADLFVGVNEEIDHRFDHLLATFENQTKEIDHLKSERSLLEEQLRNEMNELEKCTLTRFK